MDTCLLLKRDEFSLLPSLTYLGSFNKVKFQMELLSPHPSLCPLPTDFIPSVRLSLLALFCLKCFSHKQKLKPPEPLQFLQLLQINVLSFRVQDFYSSEIVLQLFRNSSSAQKV
ncbi:hypothetical protein ATANTOWER_032891 [Ataeniobius toweri]|uniref:Uncharacterized protein n=1 Tax=Ataeniobius toweri TaxID=208326 RepID=A0ABU7C5G9_9TELE|nr:hypothetical protein [Ataeniobius toweri]